MLFGPDNFLTHVKELIMGGGRDSNGNPRNDSGFLRSHVLNPAADLRTTAGLTLTAATVPAVLLTETNGMTVAVAASQTAAGTFQFVVPLDYDEATDRLEIHAIVGMDGAVDTPIFDATIYRKRAGVALSADLNPTAGAAIVESSAVRTIVLAGAGLQAGDSLTINLVTGAHTTNAVSLHSLEVRYHSTLVSYNRENSSGVSLR